MPLADLDHCLIQSESLEATRDWYVRVLGLEPGPSPDFGFPVYWLYLGGRDVLHLTEGGKRVSENRRRYLGQDSDAARGSGVIDHLAFRATGLAETIARLEELGIPFRERQVDDQGLYQLFLTDPNGVKIELNFAAAEAAGRRAPVMASDFARR
jgi:catechol 2,3-dioxygenase-like lactoylglutathione lyase family enzyme